MRNIKELLEILLNFIEKNGIDDSGLCWGVRRLFLKDVISNNEETLLYGYIDDNKPIYERDPDWGWLSGRTYPRIEWLKKQINKLD